MEAIKKIEFNKVSKIILTAILGTLLLTISAKIKIPFYPVPMTMQTFVVLFLGITLGAKIGLSQPIKYPNHNKPKIYIKLTEITNLENTLSTFRYL